MSNKIDFVVPWVDGNDPEWLKEKNRYLTDKIDTTDRQNADCRYRDMGTLHYWFRAVEKYAPWVNKIHFITWGHLPNWLNTKHEKLNIVKHSDYIPNEYLPTFNARTINMNIHRIKELSEQFVLFDDDMFLNDYVKEEFFFKNGLPRGSAILCPVFPVSDFSYTAFTNILVLNKHFKVRDCLEKNFRKFFNLEYGIRSIRNLFLCSYSDLCGFKEQHTANSFLKSTLVEIWKQEEELLSSVSKQRFRDKISVNQWLFKNWQFMTRKFEPISPKYTTRFELRNNNSLALNAIKQNKYKVICLNDGNMNYDFEKAKAEIIKTFEEKFPQKSSYEL